MRLVKAFVWGVLVGYVPGTLTYWLLRLVPLAGGLAAGFLMWKWSR